MNPTNPEAGYLRPQKSHLELMEDFRCCDKNADGKINYGEFKEFMELLEAQLSEQETSIGFREIDHDRNGLIELPEFLTWWRAQ